MALEQDRHGGDAEMAAAVGPADAPGGEEGDRQPAEVDEQRERVAVDEQDPDPVQQLGVLRVEPVGEDGLVVVEAEDRVALGDVRREGHVVPERVEVEDAAAQGVVDRQAPVGDDQGDDSDGDQELPTAGTGELRPAGPVGGGGGRCGRRRPRPPSPRHPRQIGSGRGSERQASAPASSRLEAMRVQA